MSTGIHARFKQSNSLPFVDSDRKHPSLAPSPLKRSRSIALLALAIFALIYYASRPHAPSINEVPDVTDWSKFAYSQYATDSATLCNAIMVFEALDRLGSKADRVLLYPQQWDLTVEGPKDRDSQLLNLAKETYKVKLHPVQLLAVAGSAEPGTFDHPNETFDTSITKLLAFNLTSYSRVLHLDNDITLLQPLDELFLLPPTPIAMPRAYWLPQGILTSLLLLVTPSTSELSHLLSTLVDWRSSETSALTTRTPSSQTIDMDLLNYRFGSSALILPHRPYALLTGEFRKQKHTDYLGAPEEIESWDPERVMREAKLVHFSDWPLPKPWIMWPWEAVSEMQPDCVGTRRGSIAGGSCREREIWKELYEGFRERRKDICKLLSVPAPEWRLLKKGIERAEEKAEAKKDKENEKEAEDGEKSVAGKKDNDKKSSDGDSNDREQNEKADEG
ncbi:glycosyltransferase family 8 protein [Viridothelium virens]|uniref:Glycosyltransferase family 8 protein n=1 Tax=Viridothelium virens TaxID=1048519 RepID=A0A6A6H636_VIRVR|nr:glycosyltransferase family 8 protein [Viridothelium virens]